MCGPTWCAFHTIATGQFPQQRRQILHYLFRPLVLSRNRQSPNQGNLLHPVANTYNRTFSRSLSIRSLRPAYNRAATRAPPSQRLKKSPSHRATYACLSQPKCGADEPNAAPLFPAPPGGGPSSPPCSPPAPSPLPSTLSSGPLSSRRRRRLGPASRVASRARCRGPTRLRQTGQVLALCSHC